MMIHKIVFFVVCIAFIGSASFANAAIGVNLPNPLCKTQADGVTPVDPNKCIDSLPKLITEISKYIRGIIASIAVIMIIWSGWLFLTSAGNESKIGKAKQALIWAMIGIAVALAAEGLIAVIGAVLNT